MILVETSIEKSAFRSSVGQFTANGLPGVAAVLAEFSGQRQRRPEHVEIAHGQVAQLILATHQSRKDAIASLYPCTVFSASGRNSS